MALKSEARQADIEAAVHDALRYAFAVWSKQGEDEARKYLGEETWAFAAKRYGGMRTVNAAQTNLMESGIVRNLAMHLKHVFGSPDASLIARSADATTEPSDGDVIGDREVALLFVEIWAKVGVTPPIAEVRGLRIRRGDARRVITDVLNGAREMGLLDQSHQDRSKLFDQKMRLHRIVLQRLAMKQVTGPQRRWQSPLSAYCGKRDPADSAARGVSTEKVGTVMNRMFRGGENR